MRTGLSLNALNGTQVGLGFIFQLLLLRKFGASAQTDVFFVSSAIIGLLTMAGLLFSEMFLQHYHEVALRNENSAHDFYRAVFTWSLLIGVGSFAFGLLLLRPVTAIFAPGFDDARRTMLERFFAVHGLSLIWFRTANVNNTLINAQMCFDVPYFLAIGVHIFNIVVFLSFVDRLGVMVVALAIVVSGLLSLVIQQVVLAKAYGIRVRGVAWHEEMPNLVRTSVPLRLGLQVLSLREPLITNVLSRLEVGSISLFSYAWKIMAAIFTVTNSPESQIFQVKASRLIASGKRTTVNALRAATGRKNMLLLLAGMGAGLVCLPLVLKVFVGRSGGQAAVGSLYWYFILLIPLYVVMSTEMPFALVLILTKSGKEILSVAILYITICVALVAALFRPFGATGLVVGLTVAQLVNLLIYVWLVRRELNLEA